MSVSGLNHYTLRCVPQQLPALLDFYTRVLHLTPGARPVMPFPGYWLYSEGQPIVHLAAFGNGEEGSWITSPSAPTASRPPRHCCRPKASRTRKRRSKAGQFTRSSCARPTA